MPVDLGVMAAIIQSGQILLIKREGFERRCTNYATVRGYQGRRFF